MSTPLVSLEIKNHINEDRRSALSSSWIRRLFPDTHSHHSHSCSNFSHLNSRLPLQFLPKVPNPPLLKEEVADSSELVAGFGPYWVRAAAGVFLFFQYHRQLTTGIPGNNQLRPAHEMVMSLCLNCLFKILKQGKGLLLAIELRIIQLLAGIFITLVLSISVPLIISASKEVSILQVSQTRPSCTGTWGEQREVTSFRLYIQSGLRFRHPVG